MTHKDKSRQRTPPLNDRQIFIETIRRNIQAIIVHTVAGLIFVASALGFSVSFASYFGIAPSVVKNTPILTGVSQFEWALAAATLSVTALLAQVVQMTLEARTTVQRERIFAEHIRASPDLLLVKANVSRASNYYGRLSTASLKACSTSATVVLTMSSVFIVLPWGYATIASSVIIFSTAAMYLIMKFVSKIMERSSVGIVENAKAAANWKSGISQITDDSINKYYNHYFMRIFSSGVFSYTSTAFAGVAFLILMLSGPILDINIDLGHALLTFVVIQSTLANVGRFLSSFVSASAFIHAVRPYFGGGEAGHFSDVEDQSDML